MERLSASLELGQHAAADDGCGNQGGDIFRVQPRDNFTVGAFYSGDVRKKNERVGMASDGAGGRHLVCIDVVIFAVGTQRHRRQNRNSPRAPDGLDPARLRITDFAHKTEVATRSLFLACPKGHPIRPTQTHRCTSRRNDGRDQGSIYYSRQDHESHVARLSVRNAQAVYEVALLAQQFQSSRERASSTVNYADVMTILRQLDD